MGVLRTQELLAARRLDGAKQFFSRAIDFGYSKSPEETLRDLGQGAGARGHRAGHPHVPPGRDRDALPDDRRGRPRPPHGFGDPRRGGVQGRGRSVAFPRAARSASDAVAAEAAPLERLPLRRRRPAQGDAGQVSADLGAYNALLGRSYTEIAALSRSMHKSQGFGSAERRGTWLNDFKNVAGTRRGKGPLRGNRSHVGKIRREGKRNTKRFLERWKRDFRASGPGGLVPGTRAGVDRRRADDRDDQASALSLFPFQENLRSPPLRKQNDIADAIRACLGLWVEAVASEPSAAPGASLKVATMILNRSSRPATLESVSVTYAAAPRRGRRPRRERAAAPGDRADAPDGRRDDAAVLAARAPRKGPLHGRRPVAHRPARKPAAARRALRRARRRRLDPVRGARRLPPHGSRQGRGLPAVRDHAARDGDVRREGLRVRIGAAEEGARHARRAAAPRLGRPPPPDGGGILGVARRGAVRASRRAARSRPSSSP